MIWSWHHAISDWNVFSEYLLNLSHTEFISHL